MPGVRLTHETLRGVRVTVEHPTRAYRAPLMCPACGTTHRKKTYHLDLDGEGSTIVSPEVLQRLREAGLPGFSISNEVKRPPAQRVSVGGQVFDVVPVQEKG